MDVSYQKLYFLSMKYGLNTLIPGVGKDHGGVGFLFIPRNNSAGKKADEDLGCDPWIHCAKCVATRNKGALLLVIRSHVQ